MAPEGDTTAPATDLARKPVTVDHIHAAAMPMAALTAYQFVVAFAELPPDQTVLVNGAAGGVGHFLVQLAKARNARVIAVASGQHEDFLRGLGVDEFIDYTTTDVGAAVKDVDYLFDTVGGADAHRLLPTVKDGGQLLPVFFGDYHADEAARRGITIGGKKTDRIAQVRSDGADMAELARLVDSGELTARVDDVFPLADAAAAHRRAEQGHIQGKIVLQVDPASTATR